MIGRGAWEAARAIAWPDMVLAVLTEAYAAGADLNSWVAMTDAHLAAPFGSDEQAHRDQQELLSAITGKIAEHARGLFERARDELAKVEPP